MTSLKDIRSAINTADSIASQVHTGLNGRGWNADLAAAIHSLSQALRDLTEYVEKLEKPPK